MPHIDNRHIYTQLITKQNVAELDRSEKISKKSLVRPHLPILGSVRTEDSSLTIIALLLHERFSQAFKPRLEGPRPWPWITQPASVLGHTSTPLLSVEGRCLCLYPDQSQSISLSFLTVSIVLGRHVSRYLLVQCFVCISHIREFTKKTKAFNFGCFSHRLWKWPLYAVVSSPLPSSHVYPVFFLYLTTTNIDFRSDVTTLSIIPYTILYPYITISGGTITYELQCIIIK